MFKFDDLKVNSQNDRMTTESAYPSPTHIHAWARPIIISTCIIVAMKINHCTCNDSYIHVLYLKSQNESSDQSRGLTLSSLLWKYAIITEIITLLNLILIISISRSVFVQWLKVYKQGTHKYKGEDRHCLPFQWANRGEAREEEEYLQKTWRETMCPICTLP